MNDNKNNAIFTSRQSAGSTNCCITKSAAVLALPFFSAAKSKSLCNAWGRACILSCKAAIKVSTPEAPVIFSCTLARAFGSTSLSYTT